MKAQYMPWTAVDVADRFREAAFILRLTRDRDRAILRAGEPKAAWPSIPSELNPENWWMAYGVGRTGRDGEQAGGTRTRVRILASNEQISRMDECLHWLTWFSAPPGKLPPDIGKVIWARANRRSWRWIKKRRERTAQVNSETTLKAAYRAALLYIADRLERERVEYRRAA